MAGSKRSARGHPALAAEQELSVKFCHKLGLDYESCSPFRVPIAKLAAVQAALGG